MAVDYENDLLLITGASGKQASALLPRLAGQWKRLRLQCVSDASATRLRAQYPDADVVQAEYRELTDARRLLHGVTACFLLTPAFHPRETQFGLSIIDAAAENIRGRSNSGGGGGDDGVVPFQHLIYSSVLHPILTAMANHDSKRFVEEALVLSGVPFTVVQPSHLMDNLPIPLLASQPSPVFPARFDPAIKFSFTSVHDLGDAVARIFAGREGHFFATYQLVSTPAPLNYIEAMRIVSAELGREVTIQRISHEQAANEYFASRRRPGSDDDDDDDGDAEEDEETRAMRSGMLRMFALYESHGLVGNPNVLRMLLGREPLGYREWVRMQLAGERKV